ncbi:V/A-type H+-transporting ATPase subunit D [Brevinema andersonii]|uniref:V-type ATP synthase subunit D n=1 Tax=Brevinema andersonii TaxID=34097 RepID=A0A1I1D9H5_BREAD|nr:V-type ATP synthase subunit D [Brevinema andersonii]SFB71467.1 V/A-type H+-transporting ATPase subunit D [Brevinema andersonii]
MIQANPNRMELQNQKAKLRTATRGHKLLKDKQDALTKMFLEKVHKVKELREQADRELKRAYSYFMIARGVMDQATADMVFESSRAEIKLQVHVVNTLGVRSPAFEFEQEGSMHEYGLVGTSAEVDSALDIFSGVTLKLIELAEAEKLVELLAIEIEKTRRRVNALEYRLIPHTKEMILFITMKLDEIERSNLSRLMKVKDIVRKENT